MIITYLRGSTENKIMKKKMSQQIFGLLLPKYFLIFCIPANELLHSRVNDTIPNKECVAIDSIEL